jgi:hypothetical protein
VARGRRACPTGGDVNGFVSYASRWVQVPDDAVLLATQTYNPSGLRDPVVVAKAEAWVAEGRQPPNTDPTRPPKIGAYSIPLD